MIPIPSIWHLSPDLGLWSRLRNQYTSYMAAIPPCIFLTTFFPHSSRSYLPCAMVFCLFPVCWHRHVSGHVVKQPQELIGLKKPQTPNKQKKPQTLLKKGEFFSKLIFQDLVAGRAIPAQQNKAPVGQVGRNPVICSEHHLILETEWLGSL